MDKNDRHERSDDNQSQSSKGKRVAGYPLVELAKTPVKPPDPHNESGKRPKQLIDEATEDKNASPDRASKVLVVIGAGIIVLGVVFGLIFDIYITITMLILGLIAVSIGTFVKL